jgi:capsular polysaccharide biosynthesis protein
MSRSNPEVVSDHDHPAPAVSGFLRVRDDAANEPPAGGRPARTRFIGPDLVRSAVLVAVVALAAGLLAAGISTVLPTRYESTAELLLLPPAGNAGDGSSFGNEAERIATTQRDVLLSQRTLAPVAKAQRVGSVRELRDAVAVEIPATSDVISVSVTDGDAVRAQRLVAAVVDSYRRFIDAPGEGMLVDFRVLDEGRVPTDAASPKPLRNGAIAALLALMIGAGIVVALRRGPAKR